MANVVASLLRSSVEPDPSGLTPRAVPMFCRSFWRIPLDERTLGVCCPFSSSFSIRSSLLWTCNTNEVVCSQCMLASYCCVCGVREWEGGHAVEIKLGILEEGAKEQDLSGFPRFVVYETHQFSLTYSTRYTLIV